MNPPRFADISIVSCGTLSLELNFLKQDGFLDSPQILYTSPGLHQDIPELGRQLVKQIKRAREKTEKVIVIYGGKFCYVNVGEPTRLMQTIIEEQGPTVARSQATHCMDMLASEAERARIAKAVAGKAPVWWITPGWIKFRKDVFKGWDRGLAKENVPKHTGGAVVLDGVGYLDTYMAEHPESFLDYSGWMEIPIIPCPISLDRFKTLLADQAETLHAVRS